MHIGFPLDPVIDDLGRLRRLRIGQERRRTELIKRLNQLYVALGTRRTQVRDEWKRRYYTAKRQAPILEDRMKDHREVLDKMMRRAAASIRRSYPDSREHQELASAIEKRREVTQDEYKLAEVMLALTKAIKLRTQAEHEGRVLVAELDRRRGEVNLVKSTSPNRRSYVFSLSPRRQTTGKFGSQPLKVKGRFQPGATPRKSYLGSMIKLPPVKNLPSQRTRSQPAALLQTDSEESNGADQVFPRSNDLTVFGKASSDSTSTSALSQLDRE
ncbi:unnamed protein product [Dicrocoelium dendriticum]|nr:unnamed protein product [Dicrocoelium dendriticum]